jgi:Ni/Co efflux regulator RcnB
MNKILVAAIALSLAGASAAGAQPYPDRQNQHDGQYQQQDNRDYRGDQNWRNHQDSRGGDRNDRRRFYGHRHHRAPLVCRWRHHRQVCYRPRW